jgi:3,4-dihydroxy 2-butanone 4-phosphate synthase/GTP cyclohydrolase II
MDMNRIVQEFESLSNGELVIIYDDVETQVGAFMGLAESVTSEKINFMTKVGKGLIYVCITREKARALNLSPMVEQSTSIRNKPFAVSVDFKTSTTGISAFERADTINAFVSERTKSDDFYRPGHIFPLVSKENGLLERIGIVEAAIDLTKFFLSPPVAYTCEILNQNGGIASENELMQLSEDYGISIIRISELIDIKYNSTKWIQMVGKSNLELSNRYVDVYYIENHLFASDFNIYINRESKEMNNIIFYDECQWGDLLGIRDGCKCNNHFKDYIEVLRKGDLDCIVYHRKSNSDSVSLEKRNMIKKQVKHFLYNKEYMV